MSADVGRRQAPDAGIGHRGVVTLHLEDAGGDHEQREREAHERHADRGPIVERAGRAHPCSTWSAAGPDAPGEAKRRPSSASRKAGSASSKAGSVAVPQMT